MNIPLMENQDFEQAISLVESKSLDHPLPGHSQERNKNDASDSNSKIGIAVINEKTLFRDCLSRCLTALDAAFALDGYRDVEHWRQLASNEPGGIVLLCANGLEPTRIAIRRDMAVIVQAASEARVIVVSDTEEAIEIVEALQRGAKGYISMSAGLDVTVAAIHLVLAGGVFVPAASLTALRSVAASRLDPRMHGEQKQCLFTDRQLDVIRLLRQGEANKRIAYSLNLDESTVKIHIRNIMRKIKARNRTEIAFLTAELFENLEEKQQSLRNF